MTAARASFARRLADRIVLAWQLRLPHPFQRRRALLVHYALLGVLATKGPCTSAEVAKILRRRPTGTLMDLAVMERIWGHVASEWADEPQPRRRLYRLPDRESEN
jgi:hypothetical protein